MELKSEFRVGIPVERTWNTLTDVEFIAPCMPGAQLTEIDGDEFKGGVKIKVGPITAQYKGSARFVELDEANRRIVLEATGRESRGAGNAAAEVTAEMTPDGDGDGTVVSITTDLKVTGKVAQFGRGVMADVTEKLIGQFVSSLEEKLSEIGDQEDSGSEAGDGTADDAETTGEAAETPAESGPRQIEMAEPEPVDLLETAGRPLLKRILAPLAVVVLFLFNRRRRRKRRQG
ncbi:SRPBCC family protein [Candidatus Poriferisodalis sp.]|uniref:SRPBCC family protein n=1 Tax=Candidatus Poriferisodalis sp. TaxID=3101277 RepID=UPI003AF5A5AA